MLDILAHAANGIPRVLNQAAHLAFALADEAGQDHVDAEAAVESVTRMGLDPAADAEALATDSEPVRMVPTLARQTERVAMAEVIPMDLPRTTLPFPPVILPIENGPPTYVYGNELNDDPELTGTNRPGAEREPWAGPSDRVG